VKARGGQIRRWIDLTKNETLNEKEKREENC
jgi:hypothetical protein